MREGQPPVTVLSAATDRPHSYEWKSFDIYYGEHHDDGDDYGDESWWWKSWLQLAYNTNTRDNAELKTTSESKFAVWQEATDNDIDIDEETRWWSPARH